MPPEWAQWLARAKRLQVGDAVMLDKDTAKPQQGALAWVGEDHATYVFVDDQGLKAATMSLQELAMQLRRGAADVIPETDLPAMDRGLYSMLRNMHEEVLTQVNRDELTELLNVREFEARVETAVSDARRDGKTQALYLMDLDRFTTINDTCGRKPGDRLLKEVGRTLSKSMGNRGILARLEDDKFGALLEDSSEDQAFEIAEKQRAALEKARVTWKGEPLPLTMSVGLVEIAESNQGRISTLEAATEARARAKSSGGNCIEVYRAEAQPAAAGEARDHWMTRIEEALSGDKLLLRCQKFSPLIEGGSDKPHYEILLGLRGEKGEVLLPGEFIQAAEIHEQVVQVDRWVIAKAFNWMADNKRKLARYGGVSIKLSSLRLARSRCSGMCWISSRKASAAAQDGLSNQ